MRMKHYKGRCPSCKIKRILRNQSPAFSLIHILSILGGVHFSSENLSLRDTAKNV